MKRREFLKTVSALPLFNIACAGFGTSRARQIAQGAKIRLALIGCGGRMGQNVHYGLINQLCDEEIICLCDPDPAKRNNTANAIATRNKSLDASKFRHYFDYRQMLEKEAGNLDAVVIATPNHHHALAANLAMRQGLHVYVEKPMALTIEEVELMKAVQRQTGVVLQVGNHGHSSEGIRRFVEFAQAGIFGQIKEVWCYNDRINAMPYRPPAQQPPRGMDWDLWCGPAPICNYYKATADHGGMHPHDWHSWIGYGNGSIGNMGTHLLDAAFWALELDKTNPTSVIAPLVKWGVEGSWSMRTQVTWSFPAHGKFDALKLHWYDGLADGAELTAKFVDRIGVCRKRSYQHLPGIIEEIEKRHSVKLPQLGSIFVGEKGSAYIGAWGESIQLFPDNLRDVAKSVPKTIPREKRMSHEADWLRAIRNPERPCGCNMEFSAPLARTVLLGNVAPLAGENRLLEWDGVKFTNAPDANKYLKTTYRDGWDIHRV